MKFDVVTIGESLSNLVTAAMLAKQGKRVLVLNTKEEFREQDIYQKYEEHRYYFDIRGGILERILKELKITNLTYQVNPILCIICVDGESLPVPSDWMQYKQVLGNRFPDELGQLEAFFSIVEAIGAEWEKMLMNPQIKSLKDIQHIMKYKNRKYLDYVETHFVDPVLKRVLSVDVPYQEISFVTMAGYLTQIFKSANIDGGCAALKHAMLQCIQENHGKVIETEASEVNIFEKKLNLKGEHTEELQEAVWITDWDRNAYYEYKNSHEDQLQEKREPVNDDRYASTIVVLECEDMEPFDQQGVCVKCSTTGNQENASPVTAVATTYVLYRTGEKELVMEMQVPKERSRQDIRQMAETIVQNWNLKKVRIKEILEPEAMQNMLHLYRGVQSQWAYSPAEMNLGPDKRTASENGIYLLGDWGKAFMPCAVNMARFLTR